MQVLSSSSLNLRLITENGLVQCYTANIWVVSTTIFYRVSFIIVISSYSLQWMAGYSQWQQLFLITGIDSRQYCVSIVASAFFETVILTMNI